VSTAAAVARIRQIWELEPLVGVVLGSGLGGLADDLDERVEIAYTEIPGWPVSTAVGHAGTLVLGTLDGVPVAVMSGRAHLYEGVGADRVVFGVRVLGALGIRALVVTNASGGIDPQLEAGQLVLISDHVNLQGTSALVGPNDESLGPRFPDMSDAYDPALRARAHEAGARLGLELREGVYAAWLGPQFETPAEIRFMRAVGGDLAGMSTVQEVIAARHMGIRVLGISVVTNMAAGVLPEKIDHEVVLEVGARAASSVTALLRELVPTLSA
jgi:purine-nucleoside phosphorylase